MGMRLYQDSDGCWWIANGERKKRVDERQYPTHFVFCNGHGCGEFDITAAIDSSKYWLSLVRVIFNDHREVERADEYGLFVLTWADLEWYVPSGEFYDLMGHLKLETI